MTINDLKAGELAVIKRVEASGAVQQRLLDMGILPNVEVVKMRAALGANPAWVSVGGIQIALRRAEAGAIWVEPVEK